MPTQEGVHRLRDIEVEEVSLVDRAANQRRFLLVKRDSAMDDLKPNGRGGYTRVVKADDTPEETDKAKGKPFPGAAKPFGGGGGGDAGEKEPPKPPTPPTPPGKKPDEEKTKKVDASGAALAAELEDHVASIQELIDALADEEENEPSDVHMSKLAGCHKALGAMCQKYKGAPQEKAATQKVGRKMATARLQLFEKAIGDLQQLLAELLETPAKDKDHDPDAGDPQKAPGGWSPTNPSGVPTGDQGTAGGMTKALEAKIEGLAKAVSTLTETFGKMATLQKRSHEEIERLKAGVSGGNSMPVEKGARRTAAKSISWPLDLNQPLDRGSVAKGESFFDEE